MAAACGGGLSLELGARGGWHVARGLCHGDGPLTAPADAQLGSRRTARPGAGGVAVAV